MNTKKKYMIDTSVIIDNPLINLSHLYQNGENEIYITELVIEEMERHKTSQRAEVSWAARTFFNSFSEGKMEDVSDKKGSKKEDVILKTTLNMDTEDIELYIINREKYLNETLNGEGVPDAKIIEVANDYNMRCITNDGAFRVRAMSKGMIAESLRWDTVDDPSKLDLAKEYEVFEEEAEEELERINLKSRKWEQITIHYVDKNGNRTNKRDYFLSDGNSLEKIRTEATDFVDNLIKPINMEQKFYAEMLSKNFEIFVVDGSTGSGKTLLAVVEGMNKVKSTKSPINGIVYMRYTVNAEDKFSALGYRKGDEATKLGYFSYPLYGALNFISEQKMLKQGVKSEDLKNERNSIVKNHLTEEMIKEYNIEVIDIAHARGITITNKYVIFDEVQNAPNPILKLIGTRMGKNSSIIFMGDSNQVDHPFLSSKRNGLLTMLKLAHEDNEEVSSMVASIRLKKTIRSNIAKWFQNNLEL